MKVCEGHQQCSRLTEHIRLAIHRP